MANSVQFHPDAERELNEATLRYEWQVVGLGRRFVDEVERVVQLIVERPGLGSQLEDDLRHFVLRKFPFSIVYSVTAEIVTIVAVAHANRMPGYWRPRVHEPMVEYGP